jgi:SpoVT / AbrB like domain.
MSKHYRRRRTFTVGEIMYTEGRVVPYGRSAAITIPKQWMDAHDIRVGDTLVKVGSSILAISPKPKERISFD